MNAFVGVSPVATSAFAGNAVRVTKAAAYAAPTVYMQQMSKSVPFLLKPKNLGSLPGSDVEFDPLGISDYVDVRFLREAELKHGRVCMLACLGFVVQELYTFGGSYFPKMLSVEAHDFYMKTGGMSQMLLFIAAFEALSYYKIKQMMDGKGEPGDYSFDPLGLGKDPSKLRDYQIKELNNGRLAMLGIAGMIHSEWVTKTGVVDSLLHFKPNMGGL
eukprot:Plantae.Rhodophyta-Rhodochaete_pulchella.ctg9275.p1 GENE.Plantae.Rhodophyta-Rhodochaete_pulchella.ctg9275~~Plantae.Rhodophyta-Rhodochaete_pulchella.ctg9275.p1  ORF type:complete len:241 (-),score=46.69 Plantae.Rhodophyta-Rhodochaete_pulchella.ctg9275:530-1177(-)